MNTNKRSIGTLTLFSILAVLALLFMTDLSPHQAPSFKELPSDGKVVQVPCIIINSRVAKGGSILELQDRDGSLMEAYCPKERMANITLPCAALVTGRLDEGQEPFMFIDRIVTQN